MHLLVEADCPVFPEARARPRPWSYKGRPTRLLRPRDRRTLRVEGWELLASTGAFWLRPRLRAYRAWSNRGRPPPRARRRKSRARRVRRGRLEPGSPPAPAESCAPEVRRVRRPRKAPD